MEQLNAPGRAAAAVLLFALAAPASAQSTWYVEADAPGPGTGTPRNPYASIQYAIDQPTTLAGDTILVGPGVYHENVVLLHRGLTLLGREGPQHTVIHAREPGSTVYVRGLAQGHKPHVEGFTITGGSGTPSRLGTIGGGVYLEDTNAELVNCLVTVNRALRGGGVAATHARVAMREMVLEGNVAESAPRAKDGHGGGLFLESCAGITLRGGALVGNLAGRGGGVCANDTDLLVEKTKIRGNHVSQGDFLDEVGQGGGLFAQGGKLTVRSAVFADNLTRGWSTLGGGARLLSVEAAITDSVFENNAVGAFWPDTPAYSGDGGALSSECELFVQSSQFVRNHAPDRGGAIHGRGTFERCSIRRNTARWGGGAWTGTELALGDCFLAGLTLRGCELIENAALGEDGGALGGGVCGPAFLERCRLEGNRVRGHGGGAAGATLIGCLLASNLAAVPELEACTFGGGAYDSHLEECVVRDNVALGVGKGAGFGGGVYGGGAIRTILHGNRADFGAGVASLQGSALDHLTLWGNRASYEGGGIYFVEAGSLRNSIVWSNLPECINGAVGASEVTFSTVEGGCPGWQNSGCDPCLWAPELGDFHLTGASPCIDCGDPRCAPDADGSCCDRGALTFDMTWCGSPVTYCAAKVNSAGCTPSIGWSGTPAGTGPDDFVVRAADVLPGQQGLLLLSINRSEEPFAGGTLCVGPDLVRAGLALSSGAPSAGGCGGSYAFAVRRTDLLAKGFLPGVTVYAQIWSRDPGFAPPLDIGLTDGLRFTVCP